MYRKHKISCLDGDRGLKDTAKDKLEITWKDRPGKDTTFLIPKDKVLQPPRWHSSYTARSAHAAATPAPLRGLGLQVPVQRVCR